VGEEERERIPLWDPSEKGEMKEEGQRENGQHQKRGPYRWQTMVSRVFSHEFPKGGGRRVGPFYS